jgi:hypothetical protein
LLVGALVISAGIGGVAGYLMRSPTLHLGPQALEIEAPARLPSTDLRSALEPALERLIETSGSEASADATPLLRRLTLAARRDPQTAEWLMQRLGSADLKEPMLKELLGELGSEPKGGELVRGLLLELLGRDSPEDQMRGLRLVRALRLGRVGTSGRCGCQGGVFPAEAEAGVPSYLIAWALNEGSTIAWAPVRTGGDEPVWTLALRPGGDDSGAAAGLLQKIEEASPPWTLALEVEGGPRIPL